MLQKSVITSLLFILFNIPLLGQIGQSKVSLNWYILETEHFRIYYNDHWSSTAEKVALNLEELYKTDLSLGIERLGKTNIVLRTNTVQSNGFVAFGPFRSEFFLMPPQTPFLSSGNWLDLLTIHEYHHVLQYAKSKKGYVKAMSILFGEYGHSIASNVFLPRWFWEGDAVYTETKLSKGGRGRSSHFWKNYRAITLEGKKFPFRKAVAGAYNSFVPNHYVFGYHMSKKLKDEAGEDVFSKLIDASTLEAKVFTKSILRTTGKSIQTHFKEIKEEINRDESDKQYWNLQNLKEANPSNFYTDQLSIALDQNAIYYINKDFKHIPGIYELKSEKAIAQPGISMDGNHIFGINQDRICWTEYRKHPRWAMEDYSVVQVFNRATGKSKTLKNKARHFQPQLHPSKNELALIAIDSANQYSIQIWNVEGEPKQIQSIALPFHHAREMYYDTSGATLVLVVEKGHKQAIAQVNTTSSKVEILSPFQYEAINSPLLQGNELYFLSNFKTDQFIFKKILSEEKYYKTRRKLMHAQSIRFFPKTNSFYLNDFQSDGYRLKKIQKDELDTDFQAFHHYDTLNLEIPENIENISTLKALTNQEASIASSAEEAFTKRKIKSFIPKFKLHSYLPGFESNSGNNSLSGTLYINDILSNSSITYSFVRQLNGDNHKHDLDFQYGFLPILIGFESRHDAISISRHYEVQQENSISIRNGTYKEHRIYPYISYPIQTIQGNQQINFQPKLGYQLKTINSIIKPDRVESLLYKHSFSITKRKAFSQPNSNFGWTNELKWAIGDDGEQTVRLFQTENTFLLPGIAPTHSLQLKFNYRKHETLTYQYDWDIPLPIGYNYSVNLNSEADVYHAKEISVWAVHYQLPIAYPNLSLGKLSFIKRLRLEPFIQEGTLNQEFSGSTKKLRSMGGQLYIDAQWFQSIDMSIRLTYSKLSDSDIRTDYFGLGFELPL